MSDPTPTPPVAETRKHHKFGPSRLEYLDHCAAYVNRENSGGDASEEGQFLHDIMSEVVKAVAEKTYKTTMEQLSDWVLPNHVLTEEQQTYLRFCCRRVDDLLATNPIKILTEIPIEVKHEDGTQLNHGYLDVLLIWEDGAAALIDFKFGWIPVPAAAENLQGWNYTLAVFQMFSEVNLVKLMFWQPKLYTETDATFERKQMFEMFDRIRQVIFSAHYVQDHPEKAEKLMSPGAYCDYCALKASCTVLMKHRARAAEKMTNLPVPVSFNKLEIHTPEEWALARYWVDVIETGIEDLKKKAKEVAELNGGELRCTLPNGEEVVYEIQEKNVDRVLGDTMEVADALKDYLTLQEVLSIADLPLGKLTTAAVEAVLEIRKNEGEKITKKAAKEQIESLLETLGLLSRPDTKIKYLKLKKQQKKQIADSQSNTTQP